MALLTKQENLIAAGKSSGTIAERKLIVRKLEKAHDKINVQLNNDIAEKEQQDYIEGINALIPKAEAIANKEAGEITIPNTEAFNKQFNIVFHREMLQRARKAGLR